MVLHWQFQLPMVNHSLKLLSENSQKWRSSPLSMAHDLSRMMTLQHPHCPLCAAHPHCICDWSQPLLPCSALFKFHLFYPVTHHSSGIVMLVNLLRRVKSLQVSTGGVCTEVSVMCHKSESWLVIGVSFAVTLLIAQVTDTVWCELH